MGQKILWLLAAGALGTLARYALGNWVQQAHGTGFPWGTWVVNILGCMLFGVVWTLSEERGLFSADLRLVILTGFMGAFTTFSTYMFDTNQLLRGSQFGAAAANFFGQNLLGFGALLLGAALARIF